MNYRAQDLPEVPAQENEVGIDRVYAYLRERGISREDIDAHDIRILRCADIGKAYDDRAAVVFTHHNVRGEMEDWWSARLVELTPPTGWAAAAPKSRGKMYCPPKYPPVAYLPRTLDWTNIPQGSTIYIQESCIKAIAGAKCGTYSVGLNGVWGWGSKANELPLLPALRDLPWREKDLRCVVVFDSNAATNDDVALAIRRFAARMSLICKVKVQHLLLPKPPTEWAAADWGFDDYCAHLGLDAGRAFLSNLTNAVDVGIGELESLRLQLNEEVCIVRSLKRVVDQRTHVLMSIQDFCGVNYAHYTAPDETGEKLINVPRVWLQWPGRREVERMDYSPGDPPLVEGELINVWKGMGVEPRGGSAEPWQRLWEQLCPDANLRQWIYQWFAYPLQNLGAKTGQFLHMYGASGCGKNAVLTPIVQIYGENAISLGKERVISDFNNLYAARQFVNLDEVQGGNDRDALVLTNKLKMLVTSPTLMVNAKGREEYEMRNCLNLVTTSNYSDSIKLDDGDRRACVIHCKTPTEIIFDAAYWDSYFAWIRDGGAAALYGWLLQVDMSGFDPHGRAPHTEAKEFMTDATRSSMEQWVRTLWADPTEVLPPVLLGAECLTSEQLAWAYLAGDAGAHASTGLKIALGKRMQEVGFNTVKVKVAGATKRFWILVDRDSPDLWDSDRVKRQWDAHCGKLGGGL